MNIGIYGDSFAEFSKEASMFHWSTIIKEKLNADVEQFGRPSTALFYSYNKFLENYTKHDLIIFAVTDPDRYIKVFDWIDRPRQSNDHIGTYGNVLDLKTHASNEQDKKMLSHLEGWFIMSDSEYNSTMNELMMKHMESLHKNIIFYPCFEKSFLPERYNQSEFPKACAMFLLLMTQIKAIKYRGYTTISPLHCMNENTKVLAGHLAPEMNAYVAEAMLAKITTGDWKFSDLDNVKMKHPASYYYND